MWKAGLEQSFSPTPESATGKYIPDLLAHSNFHYSCKVKTSVPLATLHHCMPRRELNAHLYAESHNDKKIDENLTDGTFLPKSSRI